LSLGCGDVDLISEKSLRGYYQKDQKSSDPLYKKGTRYGGVFHGLVRNNLHGKFRVPRRCTIFSCQLKREGKEGKDFSYDLLSSGKGRLEVKMERGKRPNKSGFHLAELREKRGETAVPFLIQKEGV